MMIMLSHPHPQSESPLLEKSPLPHPLFPPQQKSKIIIQIMELHPHPLLLKVEDVLHPHPVAVKSLILLPPKGFCFMVYHMYYGLYVFL